jgi:integrase
VGINERVRINSTSVKALTTGEVISDAEIKGFFARRLPSGNVTFGFRYTAAEGGRLTMPLGMLGSVTPDEARNAAKINAGRVAANANPVAERAQKRADATKSKYTVDYILDQWLALYARGPDPLRTADEIAGAFNKHVRTTRTDDNVPPGWKPGKGAIGHIVIYDLTRKDVTAMVDAIVAQGSPVGCDRILAYVGSALNWWRIRDDNFITMPIVKGMVRNSNSKRRRRRSLSLEELCDVWIASDEIGSDAPAFFPAFVKTLILLGCRRNEAADMHTREFGHGNKVADWTIPEARYKTKVDHLLPLPDAVLTLLPERKNGFVFSSDGGHTPFSGFSKAVTALKEAVNALRKREGRSPIAKWQLRDLRRTARSTMVSKALGVPDLHAKAVLGHRIGGIDGVYNVHDYYEEKSDALVAWAKYVTEAVELRMARRRTGARVAR